MSEAENSILRRMSVEELRTMRRTLFKAWAQTINSEQAAHQQLIDVEDELIERGEGPSHG